MATQTQTVAAIDVTVSLLEHKRHGRRIRVDSIHGMKSWPVAESGAAVLYAAKVIDFMVEAMKIEHRPTK